MDDPMALDTGVENTKSSRRMPPRAQARKGGKAIAFARPNWTRWEPRATTLRYPAARSTARFFSASRTISKRRTRTMAHRRRSLFRQERSRRDDRQANREPLGGDEPWSAARGPDRQLRGAGGRASPQAQAGPRQAGPVSDPFSLTGQLDLSIERFGERVCRKEDQPSPVRARASRLRHGLDEVQNFLRAGRILTPFSPPGGQGHDDPGDGENQPARHEADLRDR